jgi:ABC-type phosphate/phosphonate transport system substrate-binding protein
MYFKIILILFLPLFLYSQEKEISHKLAYISAINTNLKYKNSKNALQKWVNNITKSITTQLNFEVYTNNILMINDYFEKDIDILVFTPLDYMKNINSFKQTTKEFWYLRKDMNYNFHKKYLIVNRSSNINSLKDFKNKKIAISDVNKSAKLFLEKKYLEIFKKSPKEILKNIEVIKGNSLLLNVYFGKYEAAIINSNEYDTMIELNPSITKKIKILEESPRIFNVVTIAFNNSLSDNDMKYYHTLLNDFLNDKSKTELFNLLKIKSIDTQGDKFNELATYYKDYIKLKNKYDK